MQLDGFMDKETRAVSGVIFSKYLKAMQAVLAVLKCVGAHVNHVPGSCHGICPFASFTGRGGEVTVLTFG